MKKTASHPIHRAAALGLRLACLALLPGLIQRAGADTTIATGSTVSVTTSPDPATYFGGAGVITMQNGSTLQINPGSNGTYNISNGFVLSGTGGTVNLKVNRNDTIYNFTGPFSSNASAAQTLALFTGYAGNGDREEMTFDTSLPNASGGGKLSVAVTFRTQTASFSYLNLKGANSFTGDLTLAQTGASHTSYLTVGGRGYKLTNSTPGFTPGSGGLAANYPGNVSLGTGTNFVYASSAAQNMAGVISGVGALRVSGSGALTLSNTNTYTGNTTVDSGGSLVLANGGGLKFVVTDSTNNKITGAGSATSQRHLHPRHLRGHRHQRQLDARRHGGQVLRSNVRDCRFFRTVGQHLHQDIRRPVMDLRQIHRRAQPVLRGAHHLLWHPRFRTA